MEEMARIAHVNAEFGGRLCPEFEDVSVMLYEMEVDVDHLKEYQTENRRKTLDR